PATTLTYPLSLHDALPISSHSPATQPAAARRNPHPLPCFSGQALPDSCSSGAAQDRPTNDQRRTTNDERPTTNDQRKAVFVAGRDRKSTRLNSSHVAISYA